MLPLFTFLTAPSNRSTRPRNILLAVTVLSGVLPLSAQTTSTAIVGTVTDPSGAVVTGATVTLLQVQTGIKRSDLTSSTGDYAFPLLDPGEYSVTVEAPMRRRASE